MSNLRVLISVFDKSNLEPFVKGLNEINAEILSTGGTSKFISNLGIPVTDVSDLTNFPELFGGRVKTLHPKVHGGILYKRDNSDHIEQAKDNFIVPIDMVVVNLYPFEETVSKEDITRDEAIEQIDIGGPSMLRSAAKNYKSVSVVIDTFDYKLVLSEIVNNGKVSLKTRERLASKAFQITSNYDKAIVDYFSRKRLKEVSSEDSFNNNYGNEFSIKLPFYQDLRYGENPHQKASIYGKFDKYFKQLQGKALSYTNVVDIISASELILEFKRHAVAILKHNNPCGIGVDDTSLRNAWKKAFETDKQSPFGGVVVCNRSLDVDLARIIVEIFTDVIIAPGFDIKAQAILKKKKNLRLIKMEDEFKNVLNDPFVRSIPGGVLVMDKDNKALGMENIESKVVSKRPPTAKEVDAMRFAWRAVKQVKSNAVLFSSNDRTLAIGAGQMSRIDSCSIAVWKAKQAGLDLTGSVIASDAMFPFADGLEIALKAGAKAVIQPGGSIRDDEVIKMADKYEASMVFTGNRHFLH